MPSHALLLCYNTRAADADTLLLARSAGKQATVERPSLLFFALLLPHTPDWMSRVPGDMRRAAKVGHRKSRNGCKKCKARRVKVSQPPPPSGPELPAPWLTRPPPPRPARLSPTVR